MYRWGYHSRVVFSQGAVGTRGYYGVLPSDRNVPYIHGVYNIVLARVGDSGLVVTPLIQDGTYPVRRIATLGPRVLVVQVYLQPPFPVILYLTVPYLPRTALPPLGVHTLTGGGILAGNRGE